MLHRVQPIVLLEKIMKPSQPQKPLSCEEAIDSLKAALIRAEEDDVDTDDVMRGVHKSTVAV